MSFKLTPLIRKLAVCLVALYITCLPSPGEAAKEIRYLPFNFTISVLATSNVRGHIIDWDYSIPKTADLGLVKTFTLVKKERSDNNLTLLLDAGDTLYGSALTNHYAQTGFKGLHPIVRAQNYMFYDAIALGDNEFDYGKDQLTTTISKSNAPVLAANIHDANTGKLWDKTKPYLIKTFEVGDKAKYKINIGIIGVIAEAPNPENSEGLIFTDPVEAVQKYVKEVQKKKVDAIIVVTHAGVNASEGETNQIIAIAESCPEINLIISGNRRSIIDENNPIIGSDRKIAYEKGIINGVHILAPGQNGTYLGKANMLFEMFGRKYYIKSVGTTNLPIAGVESDRSLADLSWPYHDATLQNQNKIIGFASGNFTSAEVASRNTAVLELLNQAQLYHSNAQLSAASMFNFNPQINEGPITLQTAHSLYPMESYLYSIEITGSQLKRYLEHSARYFKTFKEGDRVIRVGGEKDDLTEFNFDIIKGVDYVIDVSQPVGSRIKELKYNGRAVEPVDVFTLALSSFRYNNGGGYMDAIGFEKNNPPPPVYDSKLALGVNGQLRELLVQYIKAKETIAPVTPTNFRVVSQ